MTNKSVDRKRFVYIYLTLDDKDGEKACSTQLAKIVDTDKYMCCVKCVRGKIIHSKYKQSDRLFLCSDICQESYVNSTKLPVLCELFRKENGFIENTFTHVQWLDLLRPNLGTIKLYITDDQGNNVPLEGEQLMCTLVLSYHPI